MAMNEKVVMVSNGYERIDGRNAYKSGIKRLTLGAPMLEENKKMQIAAQIWKNDKDGELILAQELPIHQIFDLMIFLSRTLLYFKDAYRLPLLYDPEKTPRGTCWATRRCATCRGVCRQSKHQ
jgi:hypothetical protein